MSAFVDSLVPIALFAVAVVLVLGLANLMRSGSGNRSQLLMRWRIGLQFLAIVVVVVAVWLKQR